MNMYRCKHGRDWVDPAASVYCTCEAMASRERELAAHSRALEVMRLAAQVMASARYNSSAQRMEIYDSPGLGFVDCHGLSQRLLCAAEDLDDPHRHTQHQHIDLVAAAAMAEVGGCG